MFFDDGHVLHEDSTMVKQHGLESGVLLGPRLKVAWFVVDSYGDDDAG